MVIHQNQTSIKVRNEENVIEPHKHVKHDNFENFTKFTIFKKNCSNCSTLGAANTKSHEDVPHFAPVKDFLILTLHTPRPSLD